MAFTLSRLGKQRILISGVLAPVAILLLLYGLHVATRALPRLTQQIDSPTRNLPDFQSIADISERKIAFRDFLIPLIAAENDHLARLRQHVIKLKEKAKSGKTLNRRETRWLTRVSHLYQVTEDEFVSTAEAEWTLLLRRIDTLPPSLVLAQAALESGWGTSRFARQGLNLFGQWCYQKGCGLVPRKRHSQQHHEVEKFASVEDSIQRYFLNLNRLAVYRPLRVIREAQRSRNQSLQGESLARGLRGYSEQGALYIEKVQTTITANGLDQLD